MIDAALPKLLIVEDDAGLQRQLRWAYDAYEVIVAADRASAIDALRAEEPAVVTLDLGLPPDPDGVTEGFATLADDPVAQARHQGDRRLRPWRARKRAAGDRARAPMISMPKPVDIDLLGLIVARAFHVHALEDENRRLASGRRRAHRAGRDRHRARRRC